MIEAMREGSYEGFALVSDFYEVATISCTDGEWRSLTSEEKTRMVRCIQAAVEEWIRTRQENFRSAQQTLDEVKREEGRAGAFEPGDEKRRGATDREPSDHGRVCSRRLPGRLVN